LEIEMVIVDDVLRISLTVAKPTTWPRSRHVSRSPQLTLKIAKSIELRHGYVTVRAALKEHAFRRVAVETVSPFKLI